MLSPAGGDHVRYRVDASGRDARFVGWDRAQERFVAVKRYRFRLKK